MIISFKFLITLISSSLSIRVKKIENGVVLNKTEILNLLFESLIDCSNRGTNNVEVFFDKSIVITFKTSENNNFNFKILEIKKNDYNFLKDILMGGAEAMEIYTVEINGNKVKFIFICLLDEYFIIKKQDEVNLGDFILEDSQKGIIKFLDIIELTELFILNREKYQRKISLINFTLSNLSISQNKAAKKLFSEKKSGFELLVLSDYFPVKCTTNLIIQEKK